MGVDLVSSQMLMELTWKSKQKVGAAANDLAEALEASIAWCMPPYFVVSLACRRSARQSKNTEPTCTVVYMTHISAIQVTYGE